MVVDSPFYELIRWSLIDYHNLGDRIQDGIIVDVELFLSDDQSCCGHVEEIGEQSYEIEINLKMSDIEKSKTLFHELTHISQYVNGYYIPEENIWKGVKYDGTRLPWEGDAHAHEEIMYDIANRELPNLEIKSLWKKTRKRTTFQHLI